MLRRNGKPRSCEPCRISKIRCDHTTPTCDKCRARGLTEQCFYHPNPMTKPPGVPRKKPEPRRRVAERRHSETRNHETPTTPLASVFDDRTHPVMSLSPTALRNEDNSMSSSHVNTWPTPPESVARTSQNGTDAAHSFYLGSTSYASVFAEEQQLPESIHEQPADKVITSPVESSRAQGVRHCRMGIGVSVIAKLQPFAFLERSVESYFVINKAPALIGPLITSAFPQLRKDLEHLTSKTSDPYLAYAEITKNSARPLKVPSNMLASDFHTLFTGPNLRWEILGLVMILAASSSQFTDPNDPIFVLEDGTRINKDRFIEDMIHASNDCIGLCQVHGAVNDIMVWLLYTNMLVMSNFYGDNYHGVWRRMGETISALYAEGIHCEDNDKCVEPLFLRESRRRIYSACYRSDKSLATFFGRPPMMNWRYSDRKLPLDLDDSVVTSDNQELFNEALSKLDSNGWGTEGICRGTSWIRLRTKMSLVKERFLELSLAGRKSSDVTSEIEAIHSENRQCWNALPAHLRYELYDEEEVWNTLGSRITLRMISSYLEYLHMDFQIQRLLRRQTQTALPGLLEISMKLLSTVLVFNKRRNTEYNVQRHLATLVLFYCLPSAGVLALELRRCTRQNVPLPSTVSRADIIRNLSVLISCIEWSIMPDDGNHRLCVELNKMLALVLDEVLNFQPPVQDVQGDGGDGTIAGLGPEYFDIPMIDGVEPIPMESEALLEWLDNANWSNTYLV